MEHWMPFFDVWNEQQSFISRQKNKNFYYFGQNFCALMECWDKNLIVKDILMDVEKLKDRRVLNFNLRLCSVK